MHCSRLMSTNKDLLTYLLTYLFRRHAVVDVDYTEIGGDEEVPLGEEFQEHLSSSLVLARQETVAGN